MSKEKAKTETTRVNQLLAQSKPTNALIEKALAKKQEEEDARKLDRILHEMECIDHVVEHGVSRLRQAREVEKTERKKVVALDNARKKYNEDADFEAFKKVVRENDMGHIL